VKGVADKRAAQLSKAGLQVNGQSKEGAAMAEAKADKPEKAAKPAAAKGDAKVAGAKAAM
jgi:competence protein ComEA